MTEIHVIFPNGTHTNFATEEEAREFASWAPCSFRLVAFTTVNHNITAQEITP
jgi:hypothetical protein